MSLGQVDSNKSVHPQPGLRLVSNISEADVSLGKRCTCDRAAVVNARQGKARQGPLGLALPCSRQPSVSVPIIRTLRRVDHQRARGAVRPAPQRREAPAGASRRVERFGRRQVRKVSPLEQLAHPLVSRLVAGLAQLTPLGTRLAQLAARAAHAAAQAAGSPLLTPLLAPFGVPCPREEGDEQSRVQKNGRSRR